MNRKLIGILILVLSSFYTQASDYDADLAKKLGADDYGMKRYVLITLLTGPNDKSIIDPKTRESLFKGHFANMGKLAANGVLVVAGPLMNGLPKRGIFIFNVETLEQAKALVETDPAVKAGIFDYEMVEYYGSAALMKVNEIHNTLQKTPIN